MSKRSRLNRPNGGVLTISDRKAGGNPQNNYMKKLLMMQEAGELKPGTANEVTISHDNNCAVFDGGFCGCNPSISMKPLE